MTSCVLGEEDSGHKRVSITGNWGRGITNHAAVLAVQPPMHNFNNMIHLYTHLSLSNMADSGVSFSCESLALWD